MKCGHVAYLTRGDSEATGFFWAPPDIPAFLRELMVSPPTGLEFLRDERSASATILGELGKSRVFPAVSLSCGVFLKPRVYLQTWPRAPGLVLHPMLHLAGKRKEVNIKFAHIREGAAALRKLVFKFKDLREGLIQVRNCEESLVMYVPLVRSPKTMDAQSNKKLQYWMCGGDKDPWMHSTGALYEDKEVLWEFLANLTVIRLEFDLRYRVNVDLECYLGSFKVVSPASLLIKEEHACNLLPSLTLSDIFAAQLSFPLHYLLFCLLSHGYTSIFHLSPTFLRRIQQLRCDFVEYAFTAMYKSCKTFYARPEGFECNFERYYAEAEQGSVVYAEENKDKSAESHLLRRVLVTPSTVYFTLPSRELSNRVTREYSQHLDRFLRLSFVDERLSSLSSPSVPIRARIAEDFLPNFCFFDRNYELLSFSSSQLRAGSLWMWANLPGLTAGHIRAWLGDFSAIKNPAKYSSRVGLCFSNSKHTLEVEDSWLTHIPEIVVETENKSYTMSDGAGTISAELAALVTQEGNWNLDMSRAFQVRIGGIKGVVALDPSLEGKKLCYRDSMQKFHSQHRGLEVLNVAQFRYGYLNRQIILLLSTLGVKDPVFRKLQNDYLDSLKEVFTVPTELKAKLLVAESDEAGSPPLVETLKSMLDAGFSPATDPFLRSAAQALYCRMVMELRQKQRILVNRSACLMGVLDETGTLEYGQTYVRLRYHSANMDLVEETLTDYIAITKNPCFHPGDVRKLKAIDAPALRHHVNVVVFPSKGPRPHPNEISGSDLDGDLYFLTWEPGLVPRETVAPMDYTASGMQEQVDEMNSERMKDFFLKFICNDNLGMIANAHLALADESPAKANDERCLKLARMHSTAVDFSKTGVSEAIPKELKPKTYPDFMENKNKQFYESTKVIGVLYRQVRDFKFHPESCASVQLDSPFPELHSTASALYSLYKSELSAIMNLFNIDSEAEILTGEVVKYSKFYNNNKKKRREETRTKLKDLVTKLQTGMKAIFCSKSAPEDRHQLAQECKYVAYVEGKYSGFPWVIGAEYLLEGQH